MRVAVTVSCYYEKQYKTSYPSSLIKASSVVLSCISSWQMSSGVLDCLQSTQAKHCDLVFIIGRDAVYICRHIFITSCRKKDPKANKTTLFLGKQHEKNRIFRWFYQHTCISTFCICPPPFTHCNLWVNFCQIWLKCYSPENATFYVCYVNITKTDVWKEEKKTYEDLCWGIH